MIFKDTELLLTTSPTLIIDDIEAVIVHLDKLNTTKCEHIDMQIPGYHLLNRIGFKEAADLWGVIEYIDRHMEQIWEMAEYNAYEYAAASVQ